jgi:ParB-like chromosome segregation protein Spo0J
MQINEKIKQEFDKAEDKIEFLNNLKKYLTNLSPIKQPVDFVKWVKIEEVEPNDYNPNSVAKVEMGLLYKSIEHDGYTQPVVTIYDEEKKKYVIVDGFHRYFVAKTQKDIRELNKGYLPVVVIDKDINERMSATIRHNRARGEHSIKGMSNTVFKMLENGWSDEEICNQLGMEPEEILKLKHLTGFSKLFENKEYQRAWESKNQIKLREQHKKQNKVNKDYY